MKEDTTLRDHRLQLARIVVDKAIIGLLLALFALFTNTYLESVKSKEQTRRFFNEKHYEEIRKVWSAGEDLDDAFDAYIHADSAATDSLRAAYQLAINRMGRTVNEGIVIIAVRKSKLIGQIEGLTWLHEGIAAVDTASDNKGRYPDVADYRSLIEHVNARVAFLHGVNLGLVSDESSFDLEEMFTDDARKLGARKYLENQKTRFDDWKKVRKP